MVYAYPEPIELPCSNEKEEEAEAIAVDENPPLSAIQQFYEGANVFVTGGTGFIGMALIEKLLRSCPGVKKLFLLIRSQKGKTSEERAKEMFLNPVFLRLFESNPNILEKVKIVPGDVEQINLGISAADAEMLKKEINVVINVAATVRFDEYLRKAYIVNVVSLKAMLALAESMSNLKAFIHTSTAFVHTHRKSPYVKEKFYAPPKCTEAEIEALLSSADDYTIACMDRLILGEFPNTYTFTKAISENIIRQKMKSLPLAVYRPSIVLNSYSEPTPGWSSTLQSVGSVSVGIGLGVLRVVNFLPNKRTDVIPVDKCACALIALPWRTYNLSQKKVEQAHPPIYNHVCDRNPITWQRLYDHALQFQKRDKMVSKYAIWAVNLSLEKNPLLFQIKNFFYHVLPLPLFVLAEKLQGQPPRLAKVYRKITVVLAQVICFTGRNWIFEDGNVQELWDTMSDRDRRLFPFDVADLNWNEYVRVSTTGSLYYLLKESPAECQKGSLKLKILLWLDDAVTISAKAVKIFVVYKTGALVFALIKNYFESQLYRL